MSRPRTSRHRRCGSVGGAEPAAARRNCRKGMTWITPPRSGASTTASTPATSFPDLAFAVEDVVAGGDKVVARVRFTGTQNGAFAGMPPTGKSVDVALIDIMRYADDGLVQEHWGVLDAMAMMQQLGALPG